MPQLHVAWVCAPHLTHSSCCWVILIAGGVCVTSRMLKVHCASICSSGGHRAHGPAHAAGVAQLSIQAFRSRTRMLILLPDRRTTRGPSPRAMRWRRLHADMAQMRAARSVLIRQSSAGRTVTGDSSLEVSVLRIAFASSLRGEGIKKAPRPRNSWYVGAFQNYGSQRVCIPETP